MNISHIKTKERAVAHSSRKKGEVRSAYIFENLPLAQISLMQGISVATLRAWKKKACESGDDWDKLRAANLLAGEGMEAIARQTLSEYVVQHKAVMSEVLAAKDMTAQQKTQALASIADSFNKMIAASKRVLPMSDELAIALRVIQLLTEFVRQKFPQHTQALLEILEPFTEEVAAKLGGKGGA